MTLEGAMNGLLVAAQMGRGVLDDLHPWLKTAFDAASFTAAALSLTYLGITLWVLLFHRRRPYPFLRPDDARLPTVTVQIPTYNERAAIHCARRCLAFQYPPEKLQIVIGDDSNDPAVMRALDTLVATESRLTISRRGDNRGYKPGNLNHMLPRSRGDYILVLDSDFLPDPDFLVKMVSPAVADPALAGVQARWRIVNAHQNHVTALGAGIVNTLHAIMLPFVRMMGGSGIFCGSAELVRKADLEALGGWQAGALTEDVEFSLRLLRHGRRIFYLEEVECLCEVPHASRDLLRQQMRWAYGVMRSFMEHGWRLGLRRAVTWRAKLSAFFFGSGYLMTTAFAVMLICGFLSTVTDVGMAAPAVHPKGAFWRSLLEIIMGSGFFVATLCAGFLSGFGMRGVGRLILGAFTIGLALTLFVSIGLWKALAGQPMPWFMLRKNGNAQPI